MLSEEILAALITAFVAILTAYFAFRQSQSRMKKEFTFNALEVTYFNESFVLSRQIISQAEKTGLGHMSLCQKTSKKQSAIF